MLAWSSCITRCRMRCEPVRCTSTLMPGYSASKSLAIFSALDRAREVYQTTLPSFRAASTRVSCASPGRPAKNPARMSTRATARQRVMDLPLRGQGAHQSVQVWLARQVSREADHRARLRVGRGQRGVATELALDLLARHGKVGSASGPVLAFLEDASVAEMHRHASHELTRIVDGGVDLVADGARHREHAWIPGRLVGELREGGAPLHEHHGEEIGEAELGCVPVGGTMLVGERLPEARHRPLRGATRHAGDVLGPDPLRVAEPQCAVHVGLGDGATGIRLEGELAQLPFLSQGGEQGLDGRRGVDPGKGLIEAVRPFENRFRSREAARARSAAATPAWPAQPGWRRFVQDPSARYSMMPPAWLPQIPKAWTS